MRFYGVRAFARVFLFEMRADEVGRDGERGVGVEWRRGVGVGGAGGLGRGRVGDEGGPET